MRSGSVCARRPPELRTVESACSSSPGAETPWLTPCTAHGTGGETWERIKEEQAKWATPSTAAACGYTRDPEKQAAQRVKESKGHDGNQTLRQAEEFAGRWPTPTTGDEQRGRQPFLGGPTNPSLGSAVDAWPTPVACPKGPGGEGKREGGPTLQTVAQNQWPTPRAKAAGEDDTKGGSDLQHRAAEWPTPSSMNQNGGDALSPGMAHRAGRTPGNLYEAVARVIWPTPSRQDLVGSRRATARTSAWKSNPGTTLTDAMLLFSLPDLAIPSGPASSPQIRRSPLRLNPRFVEWLMGYPPGWTGFGPLGTRSSRYRRLLLFVYSSIEPVGERTSESARPRR